MPRRTGASLWRDGRVHVWANLAVIASSPTATLLEVSCCGRFSALERDLHRVTPNAPRPALKIRPKPR